MGTSVPYINFLTTFFIYNKNNIKTLLNLFIDKIVKKTSITMTLKKEIEKICIIIKDLTWYVKWKVTIQRQKIEMVEHREHRRSHWPKRRQWDIPPLPNTNRPEQKSFGQDNCRRQLKPIKEALKRSFQLSHGSFEEGVMVSGAN